MNAPDPPRQIPVKAPFQRTKLLNLVTALETSACVVINGPRQVGKSDLARTLAARLGMPTVTFDASIEADRTVLTSEQSPLRSSRDRILIIEEYERCPEVLDIMRATIDQVGTGVEYIGRYILVASRDNAGACPAVDRLESRVTVCNLVPVTLAEYFTVTLPRQLSSHTFDVAPNATEVVPNDTQKMLLETLWLRGGFPESLFATSAAASTNWRHGYWQRFQERGCALIEPSLLKTELANLLPQLALANGNVVADQISKKELNLLNHLSDIGLARRLQPWHRNDMYSRKRRPRFYFRDTGLLHALLGVDTLDALRRDNRQLGMSWESFCIEQILTLCPFRTMQRATFYRHAETFEIDLVLPLSDELTVLCEFGHAKKELEKNTFVAANDIGTANIMLINNLEASYERESYSVKTLPDFLTYVASKM